PLCPQVKAFVTQDIPLYHNLEMKHLPGADPELVLLSHRYEELERIPLSDMTREEINQLVQELGFYRKETPDAPVPKEFQFAPARPLPTLLPHQAPSADGETPSKRDERKHPEL
ncbi:SELM protein, partial [Alopecoenas beccarii]|nr:SELM protein [Alopecoenas beccarii]